MLSAETECEKVLHPTPDHLNRSTQNGILAQQQKSIPPFSLMPGGPGPKDILPTIAKLCSTIEDDVQDAYPCTVVQEALVSLSVKTPHMYVARYAYRLKDSITFDQFHAAWDATVRAHTIMHTRVVQLGSQGVVQVVLHQGIECQRAIVSRHTSPRIARSRCHWGLPWHGRALSRIQIQKAHWSP